MNKITLQKYALIISDLLALLTSYYFATNVVNIAQHNTYHHINIHHWSWIKALDVVLFIILFWQKQLYFKRRPNWEETRIIYKLLLVMSLINVPVLFFDHLGATTNLSIFLIFWLSLFFTIPVARSMTKLILFNAGFWQRDLYIVGVDDNALVGYELLTSSNLLGYKVCGFVDLTGRISRITIKDRNVRVLKSEELFKQNKHAEVLVCLDGQYLASHVKLINQFQTYFLSVMILPQLEGLPLYGVEVNHFFGNEQLLLRLESNLSSRFNRTIKRIFDIIIAVLLIVPVLLLGIVISLFIFFEDGGSPLFIQKRVGRKSAIFGCIKFRTMHKNAESMLENWKNHQDPIYLDYVANNYKLINDPRVTKIGRFLRKTSLDELPQLLNVLVGQMSLVGPRPLLPRELEDYQDGEFYYTQVMPGITGLWQISGRSKTSFVDRARLDSWYIKNWSLWYDIVILIKTLVVVIRREGAY